MYHLQFGLILVLLICTSKGLNITQEQKDKDGRIVGGWETTINYFPHQISLQIGTRHACGGAIVAPTLVLTAAHCVLEYHRPEQYVIRAGSSEWSTGGSYIHIRRIIPHSQFQEPTPMNNDIALIQLATPLVYSENIQPIALATKQDKIAFASQLFVSGWGSKTLTQIQPEKRLRYTALKQQDQTQCKHNYQGAGTVTPTMLCAGSPFGGRDSCQGDSGGPLITSVNGQLKLFGIVSWGLGCAHALYPGVYTRVTEYTDWLAETLNELN
ncbi:uncharacterized protein Dwil_GK20985 [Drosophila willistoni]|uniref:trypsin n=1 Tax=Drosophila willistoni TaxID=7260 RepID=B4MKE2_DROWI|nr:trypsin-4 [Drosophila willistoni]EDW72581.1 uncharacterized protein Dwil_GK20985 [Drosophila willistoni]